MRNYPLINWERIGQAVEFYSSCGYENISVPWAVCYSAILATIPEGCNPTSSTKGYLVGSAEQSFIDLILKKEFIFGRYQATTPCFRDEPIEDELHQAYFMKTELFAPSTWNPFHMAVQAYTFLSHYFKELRIERTGDRDSYDILSGDIELGSYGIRRVEVGGETVSFTYGTGLAEPRTSVAYERSIAHEQS